MDVGLEVACPWILPIAEMTSLGRPRTRFLQPVIGVGLRHTPLTVMVFALISGTGQPRTRVFPSYMSFS